MKLQQEIDKQQYDVDMLNEDIERDGQIIKRVKEKREELVEKLGTDRLKTTIYYPNGSKTDEYSFYDKGTGTAVR